MDRQATSSAIAAMLQLKVPVCSMVVIEQSEQQHEYLGKRYYFCSTGCKSRFKANPANYTTANPDSAEKVLVAAPTPASLAPSIPASALTKVGQAGTIYTCPMHPEIRQDKLGNCPICGMTLEPLVPELGGGDNKELLDFQHRFWWTLPLTATAWISAAWFKRVHFPGQGFSWR